MWDEIRNDVSISGFSVLNRYLDAKHIVGLIGTFDRETFSDNALSGVRQKRGVIFARRNLLLLGFVKFFIDCEAVQQLIRELCPKSVAVRGILFDKTGDANWTVPWHQDRSIAVKQRIDVPGYGPWSRKAGVHHVQPPVGVLQSMITFRFSLDPCEESNGPLRAIGGTHESLLSAAEVDAAVESGPETVCTTEAGGAVIMRLLLLHASSPAKQVGRRRVLHLEFGPANLPDGLTWARA